MHPLIKKPARAGLAIVVTVGGIQLAAKGTIDFPLAAANIVAPSTGDTGSIVHQITQFDTIIDVLHVSEPRSHKPSITQKST